jgi:hypothetical protein
MERHSKWPIFMRLQGSITPEMILPLLFVGGWSTAITCISKFVYNRKSPLLLIRRAPNLIVTLVGIHSLLLTVLGFVVALALSFRSSTAYERYSEGRRYWTQLVFASQNFARLVWVHAEEREGEVGKQDLLAKLTCLNLVVAFAIALKHRLHFEPYTHYDDLKYLVGHLDTYARAADLPERKKKSSAFRRAALFLGIPMAVPNPRKEIKRAQAPLGNLPLEILTHLSAYVKTIFDNETLKISIYQTQALNAITTLNDVLDWHGSHPEYTASAGLRHRH